MARRVDSVLNACLALNLLISCQYPREETWIQGQKYLSELHAAKTLDAEWEEIHDCAFRWNCIARPKSAEAFGNLAIFTQCILRDYDKVFSVQIAFLICHRLNACIVDPY